MEASDSNRITRDYLDSILIETRYLDSDAPDLSCPFFGHVLPSPLMTAALSHLDHFMYPGAMRHYAQGAAKAGVLLWLGMTTDDEASMCADQGAPMVEIIKPYLNRDQILHRMQLAERLGFWAVGIDIDHSFDSAGRFDTVNGIPMKPLTQEELKAFCAATRLPLIVKGVLSRTDLQKCLQAGAAGAVISHHNNRIGYALPPLKFLHELDADEKNALPLFVDGCIAGGADAFKALALGAGGVCVGRPLMTAIRQNGADGMADWFHQANDELRKYMAFTGCGDLRHLDASVLHFTR